MRIFILAALTAFVCASTNSALAQKSVADPFAYCRSVKDTEVSLDYGKTPKVISAATNGWPTVWRCMDGDVYGCASENDRGLRMCTKVAPPTDAFRQFCAEHPNEGVPMSLKGGTPLEWQCVGTRPIMDPHYQPGQLDKGHYLVSQWKKISPVSVSAQALVSLKTITGAVLQVRDFRHDPDVFSDEHSQNNYYLRWRPSSFKDFPYVIMYSEPSRLASGGFTIGLFKPLGKNRIQAEQYLMKKLGISTEQMCRLQYILTTDNTTSQDYAGVDLKFSFCPNAVVLK